MVLKNYLKVWRAKRDITQAELALAVGLSRQTINSVEKGVFVPSVVSAMKLASFFETTVEEIFYFEEKQ
ncbi:MAG: helix-turn-helix transcriptional regulator [Candidatus Cloacimonadaceae bacterium]|nr:helix-turn-helix transcriptional regulator [Candidatus Cloacimonadaceae bacterium]MDP3113456.1 helix-turn-helix transcriptional regulator [Candidatus Cloacimonadaceae bacterium]